MKPNLILIAPNENIAQVANLVIRESEINCRVVVGNLDQGVKLARIAEKTGVEAIISRGGTFLGIQRVIDKIPLVQINVSAFDLLEALAAASQFSYKVGVVGYPNTIYDAASVGRYLNLQVMEIPVENPIQLEQQLLEAIKAGIKVIVGDTISVEIALKLGIHGVLISSGKRAIYNALTRAEELAMLRRKEVLAQERLRTILDAVGEGILATDHTQTITHCNPAVQKYLSLAQEKIIGRRLRDLIPQYQGAEELVSMAGQQYLFNSQKIAYQGQDNAGLIISVKPLKQIQETETKVRKKLHQRGLVAKHTFNDIVGNSEIINATIYKAKKISKSHATVLLTGKTGVGKEMFAQSIHNASSRCHEPFMAVNCAAFSESLLESELFGYVEGSFTDARKGGKIGLFELAHRGTIFLDEIGDMSLAVQAKVLRVMQEKEVIRLGDDRIIPVDIRIIAATNYDLWEAVKKGLFREDLYYRVNVLTLSIPTLRERGDDVVLLAKHFCSRQAPHLKIEEGAFLPLLAYDWPGNVRELFNFVEQLIVLHEGERITGEDVSNLMISTLKQGKNLLGFVHSPRRLTDGMILEALAKCNGNQSRACELLGINRSTLWRRIKKLNQ
ncbi:MAG: transcriptional regulator containing AAA-type ATPase, and DNA-binding domain [Peptococcaceae bacterium]|jgi:transcriptional regulator with PAS, ATPase and Fis domain|nr:transcriptional regulator containing AAA-type ATPase, and DNA-binding domain [Peptococcaceae bacterium]